MSNPEKGGARLMKNQHKCRELAPLLAIFGILTALALASLLTPEREFSPNENRYLQLKPELSWSTLMDGTFTKKAEDYVSDQIALRDIWMETSSLVQRSALQLEINNTWLGRDGRYFAKVTPDTFDTAQYEKNLAQVRAFFDANPDKDCRIMMVPTPAYMLYDDLPANAPLFDAAACFDTLSDTLGSKAIDLRPALAPNAEDMYYRTDHHWTSEGALTAYGAWCAATGHERQDWQLETASTCFRGTLYSAVLLPDSPYDRVTIASDAAIRSMDCDGEVSDSLYSMAALEEKDHYKIFMGGNYAKVVIDTGAGTGKSLLVVKDSFANSFLPFLVREYDTITVLDLRYYREGVQPLADQADDILVLYELTSFAADKNLYKLNKS